MTYKQFEKQLSTWRKNDREKYNQIIMLADANGIMTKRGKISKAKKNKSKYDRFISHYKNEYGSYTSYKNKLKERRKKIINELKEHDIEKEKAVKFVGKNLKEFENNMDKYSNLVSELYETIMPSGDAHSYHMYAETLPTLSDAINYLQSLLY